VPRWVEPLTVLYSFVGLLLFIEVTIGLIAIFIERDPSFASMIVLKFDHSRIIELFFGKYWRCPLNLTEW
jgi:hypothetical protein